MSELTSVDIVAGVNIYSVEGEPKALLFKAGMMVNADGSPNAYGPEDSGTDYTENGGDDSGEGDWWGGPCDAHGKPIVQKIYEPSPGHYVSATALVIPNFPDSSQYRYVDSESIPFFVMPGNHGNGAKLGDVGLCYNTETGDNCYGIFADIGPASKIGEASIRMAEALKINANPKSGGTSKKTIAYLIFPGSVGAWKPPSVWFDLANTLTKSWGGLSRLKTLLKEL